MKTITNNTEYRNAVNMAKYHNYRYFVLNSPEISDAEFDEIYFEIDRYEKSMGIILPDSPTQLAGSDLNESSHTVAHRYPMLSTEKKKTTADIQKWMEKAYKTAKNLKANDPWLSGQRIETQWFTLEWKYDGVSCSLVYQDGYLIEASTRGDTKKNLGKDILSHVNNIPNIPQVLYVGHRNENGSWAMSGTRIPGRVEVRGEILIPYPIYNNNSNLQVLYGDTRTAASSILNTVGTSRFDNQLRFVAYQLIVDEWGNYGADANPSLGHTFSHSRSLEVLSDTLGFDTAGCMIVSPIKEVAPEHNVANRIAECIAMRNTLDFPTDGLVIKLDEKRLWDAMGKTDHHHKFCCAYKFAPMSIESICTKIEYTVGEKTGKLTPVAYFNPVVINGKTFNKASVGSEATLAKFGLKVGDRVVVCLANDVIPQIQTVINK